MPLPAAKAAAAKWWIPFMVFPSGRVARMPAAVHAPGKPGQGATRRNTRRIATMPPAAGA
jgi:hypothetical protein